MAVKFWTPEHAKMPYQEFLDSQFWSYIRVIKRVQSGYRCERCNSDHFLHVHHLTYEHRGIEHLHLNDLMVLCEACHRKEHGLSVKPMERIRL